MPFIFNEETNAFEGTNAFGTSLAGFDFSVFGGMITNSGAITTTVTANSDAGIELTNTLFGTLSKAPGTAFAVDLQGNGGRNFFNDGTVIGAVATGNGWDSIINSGYIQGQVSTGSGNDRLVNQLIGGIDGGETIGTITGTVNMGNGDDTVLNLGVLHDVRLGAGNDTYSVTDLGAEDFFVLESGTPRGVAGDVRGEGGNDVLSGGTADDRFYGGGDSDTLYGGDRKDQLYGLAGNDPIFGGNGNDKIIGGIGNDLIDGGNNNDRIYAGSGNDAIYGGNGNDFVSGGAGSDYIAGDAGNDRLSGNDGNDVIEGGAGHDVMTGGAGDDAFVFMGRTGRDRIVDFDAGDRIEIFVDDASNVLYADILANTDFSGGNASIDLSALFNLGDFG
ncbi:MAG: calcium-binding protein, partial [Sulfitobacter sp.]|nr:calcium-binding protein [Sulfitobacter sp.]